jgi:cell division protein ZapA (FtsZ GTPase activity inhibitor)
MAEKLNVVTIYVAERAYRLNGVPLPEERYLRDGARLLDERMQKYQREHGSSPHEALAMAALDSIVAAQKAKENYEKLQQDVFQKVVSLDELLTEALND